MTGSLQDLYAVDDATAGLAGTHFHHLATVTLLHDGRCLRRRDARADALPGCPDPAGVRRRQSGGMNPVSGPAKERPASDRGSWGDAAATWQRLPAKSLSWVSIQGVCNYRVCAFTGKRARGDSAPRQGAE